VILSKQNYEFGMNIPNGTEIKFKETDDCFMTRVSRISSKEKAGKRRSGICRFWKFELSINGNDLMLFL